MNNQLRQRKLGTLDIVELPGNPDQGVIILLHGFGADAFDLVSLSTIYPGPTWIFPQGPLPIQFAPGYTGRAWFDIDMARLSVAMQNNQLEEVLQSFPPDLSAARMTLEDMLLRLDVPRSKVVLGGFSQGAILAVDTALHGTQKCAALLIFSGILINKSHWQKLAHLHAHTPFFQSHGAQDPILPIAKAVDLEKFLLENGLQGKLHMFNGGHSIPPTTLSNCANFLEKLIGL